MGRPPAGAWRFVGHRTPRLTPWAGGDVAIVGHVNQQAVEDLFADPFVEDVDEARGVDAKVAVDVDLGVDVL